MGNMTRSARHRLLTVARLGSLLLIPLFFVQQAAAQSAAQSNWPQRPVRLIVPLTPGGSNDVLGRVVAERLQTAVGQPVLVENRPGAGGNVGTEYVAKQPADGYTLLVSSNTHVVNPSFFARLPYDPIKDFEPVTLAVTVPFMLTVNAATPANNVRDIVQLAKSRAKGLTYGTAGPGTPHQLTVELLKTIAGGNYVHVPYKGAAGIVPALLANEIDLTVGAINSLLPHIRSGKLRALAAAGSTRVSVLPEIPTIAEALPAPGLAIDVWIGFLAPAGTPRDIVMRLNGEINRILRDPAIQKEKLNPIGLEVIATTPERYMEVMKADLQLYARIARDAGIKPE